MHYESDSPGPRPTYSYAEVTRQIKAGPARATAMATTPRVASPARVAPRSEPAVTSPTANGPGPLALHCNFKVGVFDRKVLSCRYSHGGLPRPPSMTAQATALRPRQTQGDSVFVDTMIKREAIPREFTPHLISPSARAACARGGRVAPISSRVPITPHFEGVYRYTIERFAPREGGVIRHRPSRDPRDALMVRGLYTAPNRATSSCESLHFARRAQCDMPPWVA